MKKLSQSWICPQGMRATPELETTIALRYGPKDVARTRDEIGRENDSRTWYASSLKQYLEWWLTGKRPL